MVVKTNVQPPWCWPRLLAVANPLAQSSPCLLIAIWWICALWCGCPTSHTGYFTTTMSTFQGDSSTGDFAVEPLHQRRNKLFSCLCLTTIRSADFKETNKRLAWELPERLRRRQGARTHHKGRRQSPQTVCGFGLSIHDFIPAIYDGGNIVYRGKPRLNLAKAPSPKADQHHIDQRYPEQQDQHTKCRRKRQYQCGSIRKFHTSNTVAT